MAQWGKGSCRQARQPQFNPRRKGTNFVSGLWEKKNYQPLLLSVFFFRDRLSSWCPGWLQIHSNPSSLTLGHWDQRHEPPPLADKWYLIEGPGKRTVLGSWTTKPSDSMSHFTFRGAVGSKQNGANKILVTEQGSLQRVFKVSLNLLMNLPTQYWNGL